jgi:uncharacterized membrane protein YesL
LEFKGVMGGLYKISEWIMRLSVINLLWVICSIPVFLVALMALTSTVAGALVSSLPILAILAPFTLFPATAAMFTVARKWVTGEQDVPLLKTFFRGYKENYVQSMIGGLFFVLIFVIIYINYRFYLGQAGTLRLLSILFIAFTFIITASMFNFFSIMVHLHMKIFQIIKNSILISIGNPINSVVLILCNGVILYVSFFKFTFLIPFFMGSLMAAFSFWQFHRSFQRLQTKQEQLEEKNRLREEEEQSAKESDTDGIPKD